MKFEMRIFLSFCWLSVLKISFRFGLAVIAVLFPAQKCQSNSYALIPFVLAGTTAAAHYILRSETNVKLRKEGKTRERHNEGGWHCTTRERPDMMSASEGEGAWKSGRSKGGCGNFTLQISSKCGQGGGRGVKKSQNFAEIINGSSLTMATRAHARVLDGDHRHCTAASTRQFVQGWSYLLG